MKFILTYFAGMIIASASLYLAMLGYAEWLALMVLLIGASVTISSIYAFTMEGVE